MIWWHVSATLFFCHNTLLLKILCCGHGATTQYFLKKIMCCDSKSNVLWQTCHSTLSFFKNIVLRTWRTAQYFLNKIMCCGRKNKVADTYHHSMTTDSAAEQRRCAAISRTTYHRLLDTVSVYYSFLSLFLPSREGNDSKCTKMLYMILAVTDQYANQVDWGTWYTEVTR